MKTNRTMKKVTLFWLQLFLVVSPVALSSSINKISCDDFYETFSGECRIEGECYKGIFIVVGKNTVNPTIAPISDTFNSVRLIPSKEGEAKVIAVCLKPRIEIKRFRLKVNRASFTPSKDLSSVISHLKSGLRITLFKEEQKYRCFWVHPFFNGSHYLLLMDVFMDDENKCTGVPIQTKEILLEGPTNVYYVGDSCICGDDVLIEKVGDGLKVRGKRWFQKI